MLNQHAATLNSVQWDLSEAQGGIQAMNFSFGQKFSEIEKHFADMEGNLDHHEKQFMETTVLIGTLSSNLDKLAIEVEKKNSRIQTLEDQVLYLEG